VKRRTLVLTVIAGLLVFLAVLLLNMPASWCSAALPPQVRCGEIGGSIWHGECLGLQYQGNVLGNATWNLAPGRALRGRLVGEVDIRGGELTLSANLDTTLHGVGELRAVKAQFPLDPKLSAQFPPGQRGRILADLKRVVIGAAGVPRQIDGSIELRDLQQLHEQPELLGSYELIFDGVAQPGNVLLGHIRDLGGPFIVEGNVTLSPPNNYSVQGFITGRTAAAETVVRNITLGARPDASGRTAFGFEGTY